MKSRRRTTASSVPRVATTTSRGPRAAAAAASSPDRAIDLTAENRTLRARLAETEERLRQVLDSLTEFVGIMTPQGVLTSVNRAALDVAGLAASDVLGKRIEETYWWCADPGAQARLRGDVKRAASGERVRYDASVRVREGKQMTVDFRITPLRGADGRVTHLIPSGVEITDRERALRASEERLRLALGAANAGIFDKDLRAGATTWSERVYTLLGYRPGECEAGDDAWERRVHPDDLPRIRAARRKGLARGGKYHCGYRVLWPDGSTHYVESHGRVEVGPRGEPARMLGVLIDVDARRKTKEALRRRTRELRSLVANSPDILARFDRGLRHVYVSPAIEAATGLKPEAFVGMTHRELGLSSDQCDRWAQKINWVFATGLPVDDEFDFPSPDGMRHFQLRLAAEFDHQGRVEHVLGVTRDTTTSHLAAEALRRARDVAEAANRAKDEFLTTLSHELRTPLGAVLIWAKLLRQGTLDEPRRLEAVDTIIQCAQEQAELVNDLLDASGILHGKLHADLRPVDLAGVVRATAEALAPDAVAKGIDVGVSVAEGAGVAVLGDAARLRQAVGNLFSNALKFTPAGGRVRVELTAGGRERGAVIRVRDSGEGISAEFLPRVFDRFLQADGSITRRHGGLGLGLFLVRSIVEMHGGTVAAESEGLGLGATFTVILPMAAGRAATDRPTRR